MLIELCCCCTEITDENILFEIITEIENNDGEDDDISDNTGPSKSLLSSHKVLQSVKSLRTFFSKLSSTNQDPFSCIELNLCIVD